MKNTFNTLIRSYFCLELGTVCLCCIFLPCHHTNKRILTDLSFTESRKSNLCKGGVKLHDKQMTIT